jgi:shikimate kinase
VKHVVLTGFMAVGKTAVGRRLARRLGYEFIDTDQLVERAAGMSIREVFSELGESEFRACERRVISELAPESPSVIATGGGTFVDESNRQKLKSLGVTVCLVISLATVLERVARNDARPLAQGEEARRRLSDLYESRKAAYGKADVLVETDGLTIEQAVSRVAAMIAPYLKEDRVGVARS